MGLLAISSSIQEERRSIFNGESLWEDEFIIGLLSFWFNNVTDTVMHPWAVNLSAFERKLRIIYLILFGSELMILGHLSSNFSSNCTFPVLFLLWIPTIDTQFVNNCSKSNFINENLNFPLSICTKSRISLIRFKRRLFEFKAGSMYSCVHSFTFSSVWACLREISTFYEAADATMLDPFGFCSGVFLVILLLILLSITF